MDWKKVNSFDRLGRLRILCGARWCDCGCGLVEPLSYRDMERNTGINVSVLNGLASKDEKYTHMSPLTMRRFIALGHSEKAIRDTLAGMYADE